MRRAAIVTILCLSAAACGRTANTPAQQGALDAGVRELADAYIDGFFRQFPEAATSYSLADRPHDRLSDLSPASRALRATHAILREALESAVATRVCRSELWNVSQMTGWHVSLGYLVTIQPTGGDKARQESLARWGALPQFLDTEAANLREGMKLGYTAPKHIVQIVIRQTRQLAALPVDESPFSAPARADRTLEFQARVRTLVSEQIAPAIRRYADFLEREYLPAAREAIAVAANPDGERCYAAGVRAMSTLPKSAQEVHDIGLREGARIDAEMKLFSGDLDRLGMLSSQNWRAARLVVDTGLHALGWTRQQAIEYMLAHTAQSAESAASEVDRYIILPGQATAYMLGRLEILAAREEARRAAGSGFDIKAFHDRVLEDGAVPLTFLRAKITESFRASGS
ncbi:MAG: hypothetical protein A3F70_13910 [Acidobacteria bacterium RIFCSPLOWO2_12_FULL_67_14]|nr:MAG: hypothetical protein A3H29_15320 [Acidobacteria bacterium RIFCSPLOWO2_02_FULL_67_21]OFW35126.1 MAG: hypothetical protein A3F70_13910 [Acidobacteria bacterium RIFCSPLOWO2_12_FULL_67_14]